MILQLLYRQCLFLILFFSPVIIYGQVDSILAIQDYETFDEWFTKVEKIRFSSPDSAINLYQISYEYFLKKQDYLGAVNSLVELAIVHGHKAEYQEAYDNLWQALLLADKTNDEFSKEVAYLHLGRYYSFYKREEQALKYYQKALNICKKLVKETKMPATKLTTYYYVFASTYRELEMPDKAKIYLDSAYYYHNLQETPPINGYLGFEAAYIKGAKGNYQEAIDSMLQINSWFIEVNPGYQTLLFFYIGDLYVQLNDDAKAENFYKDALLVSEQFKSHLDFTPIIYNSLSKLYLRNQDYANAYASLQKEQELDRLYFDSRSKNNASLLQIKDDFRAEKEEQMMAQLKQERKVKRLQNTLLIVTVIFLIFAGLLYFNYVRNKYKAEKELMQKKRELEIKKRELEIQQAKEVLELKNKELAASSLKLIEKDELLAALKKRLSQGKGDLKAAELKKIVRTISLSNAQNWEEFETRFVSVNRAFFDKLNKSFPKLTPGDLKLCSLIKINLSSKEIAKLMGISPQSVHTNRYRLRKKIGLKREESLTEFLAKL